MRRSVRDSWRHFLDNEVIFYTCGDVNVKVGVASSFGLGTSSALEAFSSLSWSGREGVRTDLCIPEGVFN